MLRDHVLKILLDYKNEHSKQYGIRALGIFGSVARNENNPNSDLDICVITETPDPFILVHIKEDIEEATHQKVDIVRVRDNMNPYLKDRISKEGIYV